MSDFIKGSVPIPVVAKVYGKSESWIRVGIIAGWLPIGIATRRGEQVTDVKKIGSQFGRIDYYVSAQKLYKETGYLWNGKESQVNEHEKKRTKNKMAENHQGNNI